MFPRGIVSDINRRIEIRVAVVRKLGGSNAGSAVFLNRNGESVMRTKLRLLSAAGVLTALTSAGALAQTMAPAGESTTNRMQEGSGREG